jgi:hypothetical protein
LIPLTVTAFEILRQLCIGVAVGVGVSVGCGEVVGFGVDVGYGVNCGVGVGGSKVGVGAIGTPTYKTSKIWICLFICSYSL